MSRSTPSNPFPRDPLARFTPRQRVEKQYAGFKLAALRDELAWWSRAQSDCKLDWLKKDLEERLEVLRGLIDKLDPCGHGHVIVGICQICGEENVSI